MACISKMQEAGQTRIWGNQILRIKTGDSFFCNNARKNTLIIDIKQHTHRHTHRHRHRHTHTNTQSTHTNKAQYSQIIIKSDCVVPLTLNIHSNTLKKIKELLLLTRIQTSPDLTIFKR